MKAAHRFFNKHPHAHIHTKLQIREGTEDNSKIFFLRYQQKTYVVTPHYNHLDKTVIMMGHKTCFYGEISLIIPKLSLLPPFIWSTDIHHNRIKKETSDREMVPPPLKTLVYFFSTCFRESDMSGVEELPSGLPSPSAKVSANKRQESR